MSCSMRSSGRNGARLIGMTLMVLASSCRRKRPREAPAYADDTVDWRNRMSKIFRRLAALGVGAALQGGLICVSLAQVTPPSPSPSGAAPQGEAAETQQMG